MHQMRRQLEAIAALQHRLLPRHVPQLFGWHIAVHYGVGPWPGGDYYDFLTLPDGRLVFLVADASDEGGPSSVLVAIVRVVLHSCPLTSGTDQLPFCPLRGEVVQPPHIMLGHLNRVVAENSLEEQYLTAFCGILSPADGTLHYANAGHPPPRWWHARTGELEVVRDPVGLPLGLHGHASYHHKHLEMEPGDLLVCFTDGLTTAQHHGNAFGQERLDRAIADLASQGAEAVKMGVLARLDGFMTPDVPQDDVTLVVFERLA
jgi:sigma-B regulation protein RsbU (phosphoserine phosphatase)